MNVQTLLGEVTHSRILNRNDRVFVETLMVGFISPEAYQDGVIRVIHHHHIASRPELSALQLHFTHGTWLLKHSYYVHIVVVSELSDLREGCEGKVMHDLVLGYCAVIYKLLDISEPVKHNAILVLYSSEPGRWFLD